MLSPAAEQDLPEAKAWYGLQCLPPRRPRFAQPGHESGGLNGKNTLVWGKTVKDNDKPSVLNGGPGLDWFFANFPGGDDTINNLNNPSKEHLDNNA